MYELEATRQIKAMVQAQQIGIIALTAHAMTQDREQALGAGSDDFDKPIDIVRWACPDARATSEPWHPRR